MSNLHARGQIAPKLGLQAPLMSVLHPLLVTWVGTSAGFVSPHAAHTVLQRGSQQSALGSSRRAAHSPNARGRADQPCLLVRAPRGMSLARSLDEPQPESVACEPRRAWRWTWSKPSLSARKRWTPPHLRTLSPRAPEPVREPQGPSAATASRSNEAGRAVRGPGRRASAVWSGPL